MTWEQLIAELDNLRSRVVELKEAETNRRRTDTSQKESEERFRILFENAPVGILIARRGRILFVNRSCTRMFGYESSLELQGKNLVEFIDPSCQQAVRKRIDMRDNGDDVPNTHETVALKKDGSPFPIYVETSSINLTDGRAEVAFISDISERRQVDEAMSSSYENMEKSLEQTVKSLSSMAEMRDPSTADHQVKVASIASEIAVGLGMPKEQILVIKTAALIHDIGKTVVPAEILSKPGVLNGLEWSLVQTHVEASYNIVNNIDFSWPIAEIVRQHHERLNGSGYPRGLSGDKILIEARILAIADVLEAMAADRPYRPAFPLEVALDELWQNKGLLYDPEAVEICLKPFY